MITSLLKQLGPLIAQDTTLFIIIGGLCAWAGWSACRLGAATRGLRLLFQKASSVLGATDDPVEFTTRFESVATGLDAVPSLRAGWRDFQNGLVVPAKLGRPIFSTTSIRDAFDLGGLMRARGADPRYHAALPGMLVGAGLLFTFLGLAAALASAGDVVAEGVSQDARNLALRSLLDSASVKFITSLVGLFLSIAYALWRKTCLRRVEEAMRAFYVRAEACMPFRSPAFLLSEGNVIQERLYADVQRIGTDFFVNLGSTLEREFSAGLAEHVGPLASAIGALSERLAHQNEDAMGLMLERFMERLESAIGESIRGTAHTLDVLGTRLDGVQTAMDTAAGRMAGAAEEMAVGMGRGAQSAIGGITAEIGTLVGSFREAAVEMREGNRLAGDDMSRRLAETAAALSGAVSGYQQRLEQGAAEGVGRLTAPLDSMAGHVRAMQEVTVTLAEQVRAMASAVSLGTPSLVTAAEDLRSAAGLAREGLTPMRDVAETLRGSAEGLIGATAALETSQRGSVELSTSLRSASDRFTDLDASIGDTFLRLRDGLAQYQRAIQEFVGGMDHNLAKSVSGLQAVASSLEDTVEELIRVAPGLRR